MSKGFITESRELAIRAREALDRGEHKAALALYDDLVVSEPNEPRWRRRRLEAIYVALHSMADAERRFEVAIRGLQEIVSECANDPLARFELGYALLVLSIESSISPDRVAAAGKEFVAATSLDPSGIGGWWGLMTVTELGYRCEQEGLGTAVEIAHIATQELPDDSRAWLLLATALTSLRTLDALTRARSALQTAVRLDSTNQEALILLADILESTGFADQAAATYLAVIEVEPRSWLAKAAKARLDDLRKRPRRDSGTAVGIRDSTHDDEPDPDVPSGQRLEAPPWIPWFRDWTQAAGSTQCRVLFFETAW